MPSVYTMRRLTQWVRLEPTCTDGRGTEVPYWASAKSKASVTERTTWGDVEVEILASPGHIEIMFSSDDPFFGVDLDNCIDAGDIAPWAQSVIERFPAAYAERSASGTGVHLIGLGELPRGAQRSGQIVVYALARYVTCAGDVLSGHEQIGDCSQALAAWYAEMWPATDFSAQAVSG